MRTLHRPSGRRDPALAILGIALTASVLLALGMTASAALFLHRLGADSIPLFYLLQAPASVLVTSALMRRVDRAPAARMLRRAALAAAALVPLCWALLASGAAWAAFPVYLCFALLEVVVYILVWMLTHDHFTAVESRRHSPRVTLALALGVVLGGALASALSACAGTAAILLAALPLAAALYLQVARLEARHAPLPGRHSEEPATVRAEGGALALVRRYPLIALIGATIALDVILQCAIELQVFHTYSTWFEDERALTAFLGLMNVALSVVGCGLSMFVVPRLIERFGVRGVNLLYPLSTLLGFTGLTVHAHLATAVFGHFNYEIGANHVGTVANTLNYNSLPSRIVGRVRVLNDGLVYNGALAAAGALLMVLQARCAPATIAALGVGASLLFVALGWLNGRCYRTSLARQLEERRQADGPRRLLGETPAPEGEHARAWSRLCAHLRGHRGVQHLELIVDTLRSDCARSRAGAIELLRSSLPREELRPVLPLLELLA